MTARYAQRDMHIMHIDISIIPPSSRGGMRDHFGPKRNNCSWDIHEPRNLGTCGRGSRVLEVLVSKQVECLCMR